MNNMLGSLEDKLSFEKIKSFFYENRYVLIIAVLSGIYANFLDITMFKIGIDTERYYVINDGSIYYNQQRYGSYILLKLFPFLQYHGISQISSIIFITFAALLAISRHNIPTIYKIIFTVLVVTFPNFSFLGYFHFQSSYNMLALLITVAAYRIVEYAEIKNKIILYICAVFLLFVSISSYHAMFAVYLSVMMLNVILDFINHKSFKLSIKKIIIETIIIILAQAVYFIFVFILNDGKMYHLSRHERISANNTFIEGVITGFIQIKNILTSHGFLGEHLFFLPSSILYVIFLIVYSITNKDKRYISKFIILNILFLLATFSLQIMLGGRVPSRGSLSLAFLFAGFILIIGSNYSYKIIYMSLIIFTFIAVMYHTNYITKYTMSSILQYEADKIIASNIIDKIYNVAPDIHKKPYKIVFVGKVLIPQNQRVKVRKMKDVYGASIFQWDNGNQYRMLYFLWLMGLPTSVQINNSKDIMEYGKELDKWPNDNCIKLIEDTIIVRLQ